MDDANMTQRDKIFVDGMTSFDIPDTTPDFVLGKGSFKVDTLIAFLNNHKEYAVDGYLNYAILKSKAGKRYVELDLWKFDNQKSNLSPEDVRVIQDARNAEIDMRAVTDENGNPVGIPF